METDRLSRPIDTLRAVLSFYGHELVRIVGRTEDISRTRIQLAFDRPGALPAVGEYVQVHVELPRGSARRYRRCLSCRGTVAWLANDSLRDAHTGPTQLVIEVERMSFSDPPEGIFESVSSAREKPRLVGLPGGADGQS